MGTNLCDDADRDCTACLRIEAENFRKHLDKATAIVKTWPLWKQNILGHSLEPMNKEPRKPVDNKCEHRLPPELCGNCKLDAGRLARIMRNSMPSVDDLLHALRPSIMESITTVADTGIPYR